ncbi:hypothetical protein GCM10008902_19860 [[Clostridium] innocuum]
MDIHFAVVHETPPLSGMFESAYKPEYTHLCTTAAGTLYEILLYDAAAFLEHCPH